MSKFRVTVYTLAEFSMNVDAVDEDAALDTVHSRAREFSALRLHGYDYTVALNDEWQLRDAEVKQL